jgi:hypothetical protein
LPPPSFPPDTDTPDNEPAEDEAVDSNDGENGKGLSKSTVDTIKVLSDNFDAKGISKPLIYKNLVQGVWRLMFEHVAIIHLNDV